MDLENIKFTPAQNGVGAMYARITGNPLVGEIMAAAGASSEPKDIGEHFSTLGTEIDCEKRIVKYKFLSDLSKPKISYCYFYSTGNDETDIYTDRLPMECISKSVLTKDNVREIEETYGYGEGDLDANIGWWIYEYGDEDMAFEGDTIMLYVYDENMDELPWKSECENANI